MAKKFNAILKQNIYKSETVNGKTTEKSSSAEYFTRDGIYFRKINDGKIEVRCDKCGTWYDAKKSKCPECGLFNHAAVADVNLKEDEEDDPIMFSSDKGRPETGNRSWGTDYFNTMNIPGYRSNRQVNKNDRGYGKSQYDDAREKLDSEIENDNNKEYERIKELYDTDIKRLQLDRLKKVIEKYVDGLNMMYDDQDLYSGDIRKIKRALNMYNVQFNNFQIQMKNYYTRIKNINDKTIQRLASRLRGLNKSKWLDKFELEEYDPDELNTYYENDIYQWKYYLDMFNDKIKNIGMTNTDDIEVTKYDYDAEFDKSEIDQPLQLSAPPKDMKNVIHGKGFIMYENTKLSSIEESIVFGSDLTNISDILDINEAADKPTAGNLNQAVANARKSKAAWIQGKGSIIDANRDNNIAKNMEYQYNKKDDKDPVSGQPLKEAEKVSDNTKKNITRALDNQINSAMRAKERVEQNKVRTNDRFAKNIENIDNRIQRLRQQKANATDENDDENLITESDENNKPEVIATSSDGKSIYLLDKNKKAEVINPDSLTEEDTDRISADIRREKHTQSQFNIYNSDFRPDYNDATKNYKYPVNAVAYVKNKYYPILSSGVGGKLFAAMVFGDDIPEKEMKIYNQMKSMDEVKACISEVTIAIKRLIKSGEKNFDSATNNSIMAQKSNFVNIYKQFKDK